MRNECDALSGRGRFVDHRHLARAFAARWALRASPLREGRRSMRDWPLRREFSGRLMALPLLCRCSSRRHLPACTPQFILATARFLAMAMLGFRNSLGYICKIIYAARLIGRLNFITHGLLARRSGFLPTFPRRPTALLCRLAEGYAARRQADFATFWLLA